MTQTLKISRRKRLFSMIIDHFVVCLLLIPISAIIINIKGYWANDSFSHIWTFWFFIFIYFNKDIVNSRSPAKRILGLKVIDIKTGESATSYQCFIRNLTIAIWPIEVFITLFSPKRRIGDFLSGTLVIPENKQSIYSNFRDVKSFNFKKNDLLILPTGLVYGWLLNYLMHWIIMNQ